jgi:hypothetical protein
MKKTIGAILVVTILVTMLSGCSMPYLDNSAYVKAYDAIIVQLETALDQHVYRHLSSLFAIEDFIEIYPHEAQVGSMEHLISVLDDVMYELDNLGNQSQDQTLLTYQSNIEYALKDIRSITKQFLNVDVVMSKRPNKNTLYREVYRYMSEMNEAVLQFVENDMAMSAYLDQYRQDTDAYESLRLMKAKNQMRYLYTYMMIATYIAPMEDYTGLHVNPSTPWILTERTTNMVYELSYAVLLDFREFYLSYVTLVDIMSDNAQTEDMNYFYTRIRETVDAYEVYYNIRRQYPNDFFLSGEFKSYQEDLGRFWDFKEDYEDLIQLRTNYRFIREMMFDEKLLKLMYNNSKEL